MIKLSQNLEIPRIVLDLILILMGLYYLFFQNYFSEKGKNLATKEDISEITKKIESIKYNNSVKFEMEKIIIDRKIEVSTLVTSLKEVLFKRNNHMGNEKEQMDYIFKKIPEILILLNSNVKLKEELETDILSLQNNYNEIVNYINQLRVTNSLTYTIKFDNILANLDSIQKKLLD